MDILSVCMQFPLPATGNNLITLIITSHEGLLVSLGVPCSWIAMLVGGYCNNNNQLVVEPTHPKTY